MVYGTPFDFNSTNRNGLFFRVIDILHLISFRDFRWKKFRKKINPFIDTFSEINRVNDICFINILEKTASIWFYCFGWRILFLRFPYS